MAFDPYKNGADTSAALNRGDFDEVDRLLAERQRWFEEGRNETLEARAKLAALRNRPEHAARFRSMKREV